MPSNGKWNHAAVILVQRRNAKGRKVTVKKCGPACYERGKGKASCPCGGMNVSVGRDQAIENTIRHAEAIKAQFTKPGVQWVETAFKQDELFSSVRS